MNLNIEINQANNLIPSKRALYDILTYPTGAFQYYLPSYDSRAVTEDYLFGVMKKLFLIISSKKMQAGSLLHRVRKWELAEKIEKLNLGKLGFEPNDLLKKYG